MNITSQQYKYLKDQAQKLNDIKVSFILRDGVVEIRMQDSEFVNFAQALNFVRKDARNIDRPSQDLEVVL